MMHTITVELFFNKDGCSNRQDLTAFFNSDFVEMSTHMPSTHFQSTFLVFDSTQMPSTFSTSLNTLPKAEQNKMGDEDSKVGSKEQNPVDCFSDITLRPMDLADVDDYMVWASDEKVSENCSWETLTSKEEGLKYIESVIMPHPWFRAICINNRPIGAISLCTNAAPGDKCRGELGYTLASKYWGKGIATKAVKKAVVAIFNEWPEIVRIEALADVDNLGSLKVLEKAGFVREGVLRKFYVLKGRCRDFVMFSLLSTDHETRASC